MDYAEQAYDFLRSGYAEINGLQGLLIALIATIFVSEWKKLPPVVLGAVAAHVVIDVLAPVFANDAPLVLPPIFDGWWWRYVLVLLAGYLVVIALLTFLRMAILRR